jgi:hypothetical protein
MKQEQSQTEKKRDSETKAGEGELGKRRKNDVTPSFPKAVDTFYY